MIAVVAVVIAVIVQLSRDHLAPDRPERGAIPPPTPSTPSSGTRRAPRNPTVEKFAEFEEGLEESAEFLALLKEKCSGTDAECEERQKTRQAGMRHAPRLWQS